MGKNIFEKISRKERGERKIINKLGDYLLLHELQRFDIFFS